ncbi:MAG: hypothetical protein ACOC1G_01310 [Phycisphaeraceae bacterium]
MTIANPPMGDVVVDPELLPTRKRPVGLDAVAMEKVDAAGSPAVVSPWVRFTPIVNDEGVMLDHALVVGVTVDGQPIGEMDLTIELADAAAVVASDASPPSAGVTLTLEQPTVGHANTVLLPGGDPADAWRRGHWLSSHIESLDAALAEAGFTDALSIDPQHAWFEGELNLIRFRPPALTYDPRLIGRLGDILARVGFNRSNYTGYAANPEHFAGYLTRYHLNRDHPVYRPVDATFRVAVSDFWQNYADRWQPGGMFEDRPLPAVLKLGDEIYRLRDTPQLAASPRYLELLVEEARTVTDDQPSRLGVASWGELQSPEKIAGETRVWPDDIAPEQRLANYIALRAANRATAEMYAANTAAVHEYVGSDIDTTVNLLGVLYGGGFSARAWYLQTPDYFQLADHHALDMLQVQAAVPFYPPSGPLTMSLMMPGLAAQAAERHENVTAEVMHFGARVEPAAYRHVFMSTLASGVNRITSYRFGLKATGWEWFDTPSKVNAMAEMSRLIQALSPFVAEAERPKASVAVLHAEASDIWDHPADSRSKAEVRGPWFAMRFAGVPIDVVREYMVESGELSKYRLLFVGQRNVNRVAQQAILDWVDAGGTLVLLPGAMTFDGGDQPSSLCDEALGEAVSWPAQDTAPRRYIEFASHEVRSEVDWPEVDAVVARGFALPVDGDGDVVATYADGTAAARLAKIGNGQVVAMGFSPSVGYLSGAAKSKAAWRELTVRDDAVDESVIGATREGAPYWLETNQPGHGVFLSLLKRSGAQRAITVRGDNVDAGVAWREDRAAIFLSNFATRPAGTIDVSTTLPRRFNAVRTLSGAPVQATWHDDGKVNVRLKLNDIDAVLFDDSGEFFGLGPDRVPHGFGDTQAQKRVELQAQAGANVDAIRDGESPTPRRGDLLVTYRQGEWRFGNEATLRWGGADDLPVIGDFDGDGVDEIGLVRDESGTLVWRLSGVAHGYEDDPDAGFTRLEFRHGNAGDIPLVGDWNGDGIDTPALVRPEARHFTWYLTNTLGPGSEIRFRHGNIATDRPVVGDWNDNGKTSVGLVRDTGQAWRWLLTNKLEAGVEALDRRFGDPAADLPFSGDFNGDGRDGLALLKAADARLTVAEPIDGEPKAMPAEIEGGGEGVVKAGRFAQP